METPPKLEPADAISTLVRLGTDEQGGVTLGLKAHEAAIRRMQAAAQRDLGDPVPDGYVNLLRVTNGVQINGAYFKEAENLVPENMDLGRSDVIVLGNDGNMAEHVFDRRDRRFHTINMGFPDERFASFDSFAELLLAVMRKQGAV